MKISKRHLKRIIREEYTRLKRSGLIRESGAMFMGMDPEDVIDEIQAALDRGAIDQLSLIHISEPTRPS